MLTQSTLLTVENSRRTCSPLVTCLLTMDPH